MQNFLRFGRTISLFLLGFAATACASVQVSVPGLGEASSTVSASTERVELASAVDALSVETVDWEQSGRFSVIMMGRDRGSQNAVTSYLDGVEGNPAERVSTVMGDADHALAKARRVAEAGHQAAHAIAATETDIDVLEAAIGDVRECRSLYTKALEQLAHDGAPINREEIRVLRDAFSKTISDIGYTADVVAHRVRETRDRTNLVEGPQSRSRGGL